MLTVHSLAELKAGVEATAVSRYSMPMQHALITGGSGFIGWHLADSLLQRGVRVTCLVRKSSRVERLRALGVKLVHGDVTAPECLPSAVKDVDAVFHLAGLICAFRAAELHHVNESGVRNVAAACAARTAPPTLVLVSSLAAAGPSPKGRLRVETDPVSPVSNYGRSKLAGERAAAEFAASVPVSVIRPPIVFGQGDTTTLRMIDPIARFGIHLVPSWFDYRFSAVHAQDLAAAMIAAAERGKRLSAGDDASAQGVYFVGGGEDPFYSDLGRKMAKAVGQRRLWVLRSGPIMTWTTATFFEVLARIQRRPLVVNWDKAREATAGSWGCSDERAKTELGYRPARTLDERLAETVAWYREQGWLK
jgi:nucleoside-diphosphate-sugar epimerase